MRYAIYGLCLAFALGPAHGAQTDEAAADSQLEARVARLEAALQASERSALHWSGYGVINFSAEDTFKNLQDDSPELRGRTDLERIVLSPRYDFGDGVAFVAEIEIEHGGTGAAVEYEPEEFGEYETEIEHGGEVVLEQAHLLIRQSPALNWRLGHVLVPVGMLNTHHEPSQYFTTRRSPAEAALIPNVWHATGVELFGVVGRINYQLQIINGLDSTGFSGYGWVGGGQRQVLESAVADAPAFVARADVAVSLGLTVGGAFYLGDSAANRTVDNLAGSAQVRIAEAHLRYARGPWTVRAEYLTGTLDNADAVSDANLTIFNAGDLGISRTRIGAEAHAAFIEAGFDVLSLFGPTERRLDFYLRQDRFDSMAEDDSGDVPRYDRRVTSVGLNYQFRPGIVFKGELAHQTHAGTVGDSADYAALGMGFEF